MEVFSVSLDLMIQNKTQTNKLKTYQTQCFRPVVGFGFVCRFGCQLVYHRVWIVHSPITFVDFSHVDLIFISRYFQFVLSYNPVYVRHVDSSTLVLSLSSHRPSFISLIFNSHFLDSGGVDVVQCPYILFVDLCFFYVSTSY
jgi:hypothetical protein